MGSAADKSSTVTVDDKPLKSALSMDDLNKINLNHPEYYLNRELSLLAFNWRVLQQALDQSIPLLERMRFIFICSNNLDEFFEVRVAGLRHSLARGESRYGLNGLSTEEVLRQVNEQAHKLVEEQYRIFNQELLPRLAEEDIHFLSPKHWDDEQYKWLKKYFKQQVTPVISPISLDLTHPFPRLVNKSLHFLLHLHGNDAFGRDLEFAVLHMPRSLPRIIELPEKIGGSDGHNFVYLSAIISEFAEDLFPGMEISGCYQFRLTRDSDLLLEEKGIEDLASALKRELQSRNFGAAVRLEVGESCPNKIVNFLLQKCNLTPDDLYRVNGPVNLNRLISLPDLVERPDLKFNGFTPKVPDDIQRRGVFDVVSERDVLLHHPYQSFQPVIDFVRQAASDPEVLAIKQTLYRTGSQSAIVEALIEAAQSGKEVTAVVELRARFDEASNIELAQKLQEAGVLVVYGVVGYKTHAKMTLIVKRDKKHLTRFVHLGTGNYHAGNARLYTDYSLLTSDPEICEDVHKVFQQLTGMGKVYQLHKLWHAPFTLHDNIMKSIQAETEHALAWKKAAIIIKVNSLTDQSLIEALYRASIAGVKIKLIVRGVCCLRPGIEGVSDNIEVISIIGRFLEHSRVYYFYGDGAEHVYAASADWMERNLYYRVETCFPILASPAKQQMIKELKLMTSEKIQSWHLHADGDYYFNHVKNSKKLHDLLLAKLS
ncbi:polyphosphate kinase 1 [Kangiella koreensis]|uniref:Polyphosphate kinase n=1 Tax=Kangiella koreensis (strain DSM 16069 / JCM 12317 / KCTC 12182 / SW-125) TaxID=523791 RepID=C7RAL1_KANKD|nr:polyphosphate kinase 1 [Kangiella koreensis]ACV26303.1 Polyphosphate kinase [Kangiella koreensis DSM 16069]